MFMKRMWRADFIPALLVALLCIAIALFSSSTSAGSLALSDSAERLVVGGSDCSSFLDGFAVGMGVGALFGCAWCAAGGLAAKAFALFC